MTDRLRPPFLFIASLGALVVLPAAATPLTTAQFGGATGSTPVGIAVDGSGNVFTANYGSDSVTRISADGLTTAQFGGTTGHSPTGVAVDAAGNVFTSNARYFFALPAGNDVTRISADGLATTTPFGNGNVGDSPYGIAVDAAGTVFTANYGDADVSSITAAGLLTNAFAPPGGNVPAPVAIALDSAGNVFTANYGLGANPPRAGADTVTRIRVSDLTTAQFGGTTGANPRAIAVDAAGNVFTANYGDLSVTRISADGGTTAQFGGATGDAPAGIALDPDGNVYTANDGDNTVTRINADGSGTRQYGGTTGHGPKSIAVDRDGVVYTANATDNTVTRITPDRGPLRFAPTAFADTPVGTTSALTVTVTDASAEGSVRPTSISASGPGVVVTGGTCGVGVRIPPLSTCTVIVSWSPLSAGALQDADLLIRYPGGSAEGNAVPLTGSGVTTPGGAAAAAVLTARVTSTRTRVTSGQTLRVGIRAANGGTVGAESVVSCLRLPAGLVVVQASGARRSRRTLCFDIGAVAPGASASRAITVRALSVRTQRRVVTGSIRGAGVSPVAASGVALTITGRAPAPRVTG